MKNNCLCIFIIVIIIYYLNTPTACCFKISNFSESFEKGIDYGSWILEGSWIPDHEKYFDGSRSIKSELNGKQVANISNHMTFLCPCNVSFAWSVSGGQNKMTLYDNDVPTPYKLQYNNAQKETFAWIPVDFNLADHSEHNFKWVHENPYGEGSAWIDKIFITYCVQPTFEQFSVNPENAIFLSDSVNDVKSTSTISSRFDYSIESSSSNITLFIQPPNSNNQLGPFYPNSTQKMPNGLYKHNWMKIRLNCNSIGNGTYWFLAEGSYPSIKKLGPSITTLVSRTTSKIYNITPDSQNNTYDIFLSSSKDWDINLMSEGHTWGGSKSYKANSGIVNRTWDLLWNNRESNPDALYFYLS